MANIESVKLPDGTEYNIKDAVSGYASKVTSATNGHLAGLDSNGDLTDSAIASGDVVTKVTGGTTNNFVKLDAYGKIADSGYKASDFASATDLGTLTNLTTTAKTSAVAAINELDSDKAEKSDITSIIATGATNTTGATITKGTYFYLNGALVKAKADIAVNASFTLNTNYEAVTVGGQLTDLSPLLANSLDIDNAVDISSYTSYVSAYICPKDGIVVMRIGASSTNYGAIGLKEGLDVLSTFGNSAGLTILSMPVRKGQGIMVPYNGGTGNGFIYYPFK